MSDNNQITNRLCSEIQLFDLCDLSSCSYKDGRYCVNAELLSSFEKISEREITVSERFNSDECDDQNDQDECYFDEEYSEDDFSSDDQDSIDD